MSRQFDLKLCFFSMRFFWVQTNQDYLFSSIYFIFFVSACSLFANFIMYRIKHTYILEDPFDDPPQLAELIPGNSPLGKPHDEVN
jgi:hypothetical protein